MAGADHSGGPPPLEQQGLIPPRGVVIDLGGLGLALDRVGHHPGYPLGRR